jgi:glycosyltransferase 2 family protein
MKLLLKLAVTVSLVAVIVWQLGDLREVGRLLVRIDPAYVLLVLLVSTLDRALMTYKWGRLLRGRGLRLPFFRGLQIYCASMIWGMFLPATVGADAIRAFSTSRTGLDANEVVASILIERMVGFISALLLGLLSLLLMPLLGWRVARFEPMWWLGSLVLLGSTLAFATSLSQRGFDFLHDHLLSYFAHTPITRRLRQFHLTYLAYRHEKRSLAVFFGLTFGEQLMPILFVWLIARGLGIEVGVLDILVAVSLTLLISRLPVSIDGVGVFEGAFMLLMSLAGLTAAESIAISLAGRILQTASWLPWWLAHVIGYGELRPPRLVAEGRRS